MVASNFSSYAIVLASVLAISGATYDYKEPDTPAQLVPLRNLEVIQLKPIEANTIRSNNGLDENEIFVLSGVRNGGRGGGRIGSSVNARRREGGVIRNGGTIRGNSITEVVNPRRIETSIQPTTPVNRGTVRFGGVSSVKTDESRLRGNVIRTTGTPVGEIIRKAGTPVGGVIRNTGTPVGGIIRNTGTPVGGVIRNTGIPAAVPVTTKVIASSPTRATRIRGTVGADVDETTSASVRVTFTGVSSDVSRGSQRFDFGSGIDRFADPLARLAVAIPRGGVPGRDYPILSSVPNTGFSCQGRLPGYYADTAQQAGCQAYYICQEGRTDGFLCPNGTIFNQQFFTCDWWFNVDCGSADIFFERNAQIGNVGSRGIDQTIFTSASNIQKSLTAPADTQNRGTKKTAEQQSYGGKSSHGY